MHRRVFRLVLAAAAGLVCVLAAQPSFSQTSFPKQFVTPQYLNLPNPAYNNLVGVGDLNGDGRPDILYAYSELLATGNGTFQTIALPSNQYLGGGQLADVNADGKLDVVIPVPADVECDQYPDGTWYCNYNSYAGLNVYFGNGDGTFRSGPSLNLNQYAGGTYTMAISDVNGDGKPDVLLSFQGVPEADGTEQSFVLLNNGDGSFHSVSNPFFSSVLTTGDFNGDGKTDFVAGLNSVTIYFGKGDGTFTAGPLNGNGDFYDLTSATAADFNHDGHLDLAIASPQSGVYLLLGDGSGRFTIQHISTLSATQVTAADLNHDGYEDIIAGLRGFIAIFTNHNGTLSYPQVFDMVQPAQPLSFGIADFNHDGYLDVVAGNSIAYGAPGAMFHAPVITQSAGAHSVVTGDFNRDGIQDVAVASNDGWVTILPGSGKGYLNGGPRYYTGIRAGLITAGDVNGDGIADLLVVRDGYYSPSYPSDLSVLLGNGDGTFRNSINSKVLGEPANNTLNKQVYAVDVNHDGKADLIGDWGVAIGHGDGTFSKPVPFPSSVLPIAQLAVGDINLDGNLDIVTGNFLQGTIYTFLGDGTGKFSLTHTEKLNYTTPWLQALTLADMNGDHIPDLVYVYSATPSSGSYDRVVVELGNGSGTFTFASGVRIDYNGYGYNFLLVDDFNRDGKPDVMVLTLTGSGKSALLRGTGEGALSTAQDVSLQLYPGAAIDLNGDGAPDIVGANGPGVDRVLNTGAH